MYHCNHPIYRYDHQEGRDVWFSCGMCAICKAFHLEQFQVEVDSIAWQRIQEYMKYYFFSIEETHLDTAVSCQEPIVLTAYEWLTNEETTTANPCLRCPRCKAREQQEDQDLLEMAEIAAYW